MATLSEWANDIKEAAAGLLTFSLLLWTAIVLPFVAGIGLAILRRYLTE